jgi:hypothetical protein
MVHQLTRWDTLKSHLASVFKIMPDLGMSLADQQRICSNVNKIREVIKQNEGIR